MTITGADETRNEQEAAAVFLRTFFLRQDAYGKEVPPPQEVTSVKRSVTAETITQHFAGLHRIGAYTTSTKNLCSYGCVDIDHDKPELTLKPRGFLVSLGPGLIEAGRQRGLTLFLELTKSHCWHVWLFAAEPISAAAMRRVLLLLLRDCGVDLPANAAEGGPANAIEVFPKQDAIGEDGYGNFVFLPYYRADDLTAAVVLDGPDTQNPVSLAEFCAQVQYNPKETLLALAGPDPEHGNTGTKQSNGHTQPTALDTLAARCWQFRDDLATQHDPGLSEPKWFHWVHALAAAGYGKEALAFSQLSAKHDRRSVSRIKKIVSDHNTERAKPPERCTTFGCTEQQIFQCHGRLFTREEAIINSPMDRIRLAREVPPDADESDPDEQDARARMHAKAYTYPPGVTPEDVENWQTTEDEREPSEGPAGEAPFNMPCPDLIWRGPFAAASAALRLRSWPVWATLYALFCAHVGRHLTLTHYATDYHGMDYVGVVGPTGRGKRVIQEVARVGAPDYFQAGLTAQLAFGPPNSAPALGYMIAHYERDNKTGKVKQSTIIPTPCLCVVSELGTLIAASAGSQQYNPLAEKLNELYDGDAYSHRLTDNPKGGGGSLIVKDAEFTLLGTTTKERFQETMTPQLLAIGWVSRFLWLPLRREKFLWGEAEEHVVNYAALSALRQKLYPDKTAWLPKGAVFSQLLTPEAREYFDSLREYFAGIFDEGHPAFSRHHIHFQKIAALLAWYRIAEASLATGHPVEPSITREELEVAAAVVKVAEPFTRFLLDAGADLDPSTPQNKRFEYAQIEKVREALQRIPHPMTSKRLYQYVRRRVPKIAELSAILQGLKASGEVDILPTKRGALFWPKNRPYPKGEGE